MGFDKRPTRNDIAAARRRILAVLASYAVLSLVTAVVLVRHLTHTLASLGESARQVASGDHDRRLSANRTIREVHDLAADLETMRSELVGVNAKLRTEMAERERVEVKRQALESRLRRRQRLDAVGTLASGVAHEFNNTLVPIMLFAQSVLDALPLNSPSREDVLGILRSARRSKDIVKQVLTFSRQMNVGKSEPLNLTEPVLEAVRIFGALTPAGISVVKCIEGRGPPVMADATLINLLTMNLCTNALQAMHATGGTLTVDLLR